MILTLECVMDLNTSHVKVNQVRKTGAANMILNLNTSHVKVNHEEKEELESN